MSSVRITALRRIVDQHQYEEIDGYVVDATTAAMLVAVHDALAPDNQARFDDAPFDKLVELGWSVVR